MRYLKTSSLARRAKLLGGAVAATGLALLAGCQTPPPPPPPPPPVAIVIPPKPVPPMGAPDSMTVPPLNADGERHTVNTDISTSQTVWNLRSAYNVAALNCPEARFQPILDGYKRFLGVYKAQLAAASNEIDASFRSIHSPREALRARETYQTQVYNFFSLPPVDAAFCEAAMELTTQLQGIDAAQFEIYSYRGLELMEAPFKEFYDSYDKYMSDLAAWQSRYGGGLITVRPTREQQQRIQSPTVYNSN